MSSHLARTFARQADECASVGSPMYADLLTSMTADIDAGGTTAAVLSGHEDDRGPSGVALRLLAAIHRRVLRGDQPDLAPYYPTVGGVWDHGAAWPVVRRVLSERRDELNAALDHVPQTNEVGRATALIGGLLRVADRFMVPVALHEIGASAGLNLRADLFAYEFPRFDPTMDDPGRAAWGRAGSPVVLEDAWRGPLPPLDAPLDVVERHGYDLAPIDPATLDGRIAIESYVWPDMDDRVARTRGAIALARDVPVQVDAADAVDAVRGIELREGVATVLWHSIFWQYLTRADQRAIEERIAELGAQGTVDAPFAHLFLEPTRRTPGEDHEFLVVLTTWPFGERTIIATSRPHGIPTTWE